MKKLLMFIFFISNAALADITYILPTKIGDQVFNDIMVVEDMPTIGGLKGTIEVPGSFKAQIENGSIGFKWSGVYINFEITARENGKEFKVFYKLFHPHDEKNITGYLTLEDKTVIGKITDGHIFLKEENE